MKPTLTTCRHCNGTGKEIDHVKTGAKLRALREKKGLSIRDTAKLMGVSNAYLSDMELGRRNWTDEKIEKYLKVIEGDFSPS